MGKGEKSLECNIVYYVACGEDFPVAGHIASNLSVIHALKFPRILVSSPLFPV